LLIASDGPCLFIDSDVLVCGDLAPLGDIAAPLVACPDATMLRGLERDAETLAEVEPAIGKAPLPSFNAGLMLLSQAADNAELVAEMFALLSPERWSRVASQHTDQAVWNQLFRSRLALAPPAYNFLIGHSRLYGSERTPDPDAVRMFHFNGPDKPWLPDRFAIVSEQSGIAAEAFERWRKACHAMLTDKPR
jgi:lipopolysaccharide biosynthesis glycosyltransferase